jgi:hypothetical protein
MTRREATCSCGQLSLVVEGEPVLVGICHCLACQRRTGSSYSYQALFQRPHVHIAGHSHQFTRYSDEEHEVREFNFCPECGSTVYYSTSDEPDLIFVTVGSFADPGFAPPQWSTWEDRKQSWVITPPGVQQGR